MALRGSRIENFYDLGFLVASGGFDIWVSSTSFQKYRLASTSSDRKDLRYQLKIGFLIVPYTKRDFYWSLWCQGWSNHQNEETYWGNRAAEAVEAIEVAEADEVNEAAEVSKGSKITTEDFRVIQVLEFSLFWCYFDVLKIKVFCRIMKYVSGWILTTFLLEAVEASLCHFFWKLVDETQKS